MKNDIHFRKSKKPSNLLPGDYCWPKRLSAASRPVWALVLALSLLLFGSSAARAQAQDESKLQPRLEVAESTYDAGTARAGTSVRHEFVVRNTGEGDLKILRIKPGCGCTVVNYPRVIPAGREGRITMKVRLSAQWAGERIRQASVMETNDPKARLTSLAITALVAAGD